MSFEQAYRRYQNNISTFRTFFENLYPFTTKNEKEVVERLTVEINGFQQELEKLKEERQKEGGRDSRETCCYK